MPISTYLPKKCQQLLDKIVTSLELSDASKEAMGNCEDEGKGQGKGKAGKR